MSGTIYTHYNLNRRWYERLPLIGDCLFGRRVSSVILDILGADRQLNKTFHNRKIRRPLTPVVGNDNLTEIEVQNYMDKVLAIRSELKEPALPQPKCTKG